MSSARRPLCTTETITGLRKHVLDDFHFSEQSVRNYLQTFSAYINKAGFLQLTELRVMV